MGRRLFYAKEEILAKDFNQLRNAMEKAVYETFLGRALPRLPSFIGSSFIPTISGNTVNLSPGIAFQRQTQTDGSTDVRPIVLEIVHNVAINLPSGNTQKIDLIEVQSRIVNETTENRRFKDGLNIQGQSTLVSNKWSSSIRVRQNVIADASGNYNPALGWVAVALVRSSRTTIESITDLRTFYNLFDPDFFSVYGRKNISFHKAYDGVLLIEVPFEFSDLVPKLQQISVRRLTKEKYGNLRVTNRYNTDFALNEPRDRRALKSRNQLTFNGHTTNILTVSTFTRSSFFHFGSLTNTRWINSNDYNNSSLHGFQSVWGVDVLNFPKNRLQGASNWHGATPSSAWVLGYFTQAQFNSIPSTGIYIILSNSTNPFSSTAKFLVWNIPKSQLVRDTSGRLRINRGSPPGSLSFEPLFKNADIDSTFNKFLVTTIQPITGTTNTGIYNLPSSINISSFYEVESFNFTVALKRIDFVLSTPSAGNTGFPSDGRVFDRVIIKKGTETRLTLNYEDLTVSSIGSNDAGYDASKHQVRYQYNLSDLQDLIKGTDTSFTDFNIEFEVLNNTGQDIWRANILRGGSVLSSTVDYNIIEEGIRTYVQLNGQFPFKEDDELIFSHIVPQELIDVGAGGTPEDQTASAQIASLRQQLSILNRKVTTNEADITALENAAGDVEQRVYWGMNVLTPKNAANRATATTLASLTPLVVADFNLPTSRESKLITSLLLSGAFINYIAGDTVGYYNPWFAVRAGTYDNLLFRSTQEETTLWASAGTVTLGGENYILWVRTRPLTEGKSLRIIVKSYE